MTEADRIRINKRFGGTDFEYSFDELMSRRTTFKIGGFADVAFFPNSIWQLREIIEFLHENEICSEIIGNGSNILVSDLGIEGAVIFTDGMNKISVNGEGEICAECGTTLHRAAMCACSKGLCGLEFAAGIPGTIGAGAFMNCGAYDGEMSRVVSFVDFISKDGKESGFKKEECDFQYRHSIFCDKPELIITRVHMRLERGDPTAIAEKIKEFSAYRRQKQPLDFPSAGSIFKRPDGNYAGKLIQDCGLRGYSVGGARVSEKHAGFIINTGDATCRDVRELVDIIKSRVLSEYGIELECEIRFVGRQKQDDKI